MISRELALMHLRYCVDDALSERQLKDYPGLPTPMYLAVWPSHNDMMVVAVWSYLKVELDHADVAMLAMDLLREKGWFKTHRETNPVIL